MSKNLDVLNKKIEGFKTVISQVDPMDFKFPHMALTDYELLVSTIYKLNEVIDTTNKYYNLVTEFIEWVTNEGLSNAVLERLNEWLVDGTLGDLVNDVLFNSKVDKSDFEVIEKRTEGFVNVSEFGAVGDYYLEDGSVNPNPTDDTVAIKNAMINSKKIMFNGKGYLIKDQLVLDEHILFGTYVGDSFNVKGQTRIVFKDMPTIYKHCIIQNKNSELNNILFEHAEWTPDQNNINGLGDVNRKLVVNSCGFNKFPGHGVILNRIQSNPDKSPYGTQFNNCNFDHNKNHGILIGNGANHITIINPYVRFNGSVSYGSGNNSVGLYDGIHVNGKWEAAPAGLDFEPSSLLIMGGDISYNSRYGVSFAYGNDNTMIGGYLELNNLGEIFVGSSYGTVIENPMCYEVAPTIETAEIDPVNSARNIYDFPNRIVIRGRNFGTGIKLVNGLPFESFTSFKEHDGVYLTRRDGGKGLMFNNSKDEVGYLELLDKVHLGVQNITLGGTVKSQKGIWLSPYDFWENARLLNIDNNNSEAMELGLFVTKGTLPSEQAAGLKIGANSDSNRSINAGGTINTTGLDYAEYMLKENVNDIFEKGEICGINKNGKLTKFFEESITFMVKSTNPSFVGGDNLSDNREEVDRIAFTGQVPVITKNSNEGDYIIPCNDNGLISSYSTNNPSFDEYKMSVGKVIKIEDGLTTVIIKTI